MTTPPVTPPAKSNSVVTSAKQRPFHFILDFDKTITHDDTTWLIVQGACETTCRTPEEKWRCGELWAECLQKYLAEADSHPNVRALKENRRNIDDEIWYQRSLRIIEEASVTRVGQTGILKGVSPSVWHELALLNCQSRRVKIQPGFRAFIEKLQLKGAKWGIVSVNWSQDFLRGVLGYALGSPLIADGVPILSNRVVPETGYIVGPKLGPSPRSGLAMITHSDLSTDKILLTSNDKLEAMRSLSDALRIVGPTRPRSFLKVMKGPLRKPQDEDVPFVMYVGDSMTDIECLLDADIGIVMSFKGTGTLMETLGRLNLSVLHIAFWKPQPQKSVWFARDFNDIINSSLLEELVPTHNDT